MAIIPESPDERLLAFWRSMSIEELNQQLLYLQTYQQGIVIEAFNRRKPLETFISMLLSSQTNQENIVKIMLYKAGEKR